MRSRKFVSLYLVLTSCNIQVHCTFPDDDYFTFFQVLEGHTDEIFSCSFNYEGNIVITGLYFYYV